MTSSSSPRPKKRTRSSLKSLRKLSRAASFGADLIAARRKGDFALVQPDDVEFMDVSPNQLVSIAASLIPFLEHDDANRALMGSNMQRQAVPLDPYARSARRNWYRTRGRSRLRSDHSVAAMTAKSSWSTARRSSFAARTSRSDEVGSDVDIYNLTKYQRSNQNTCVTQRPVVIVGERVKAATRWLTVLQPMRANWLLARTCSSRSCLGAVTTSRTRS